MRGHLSRGLITAEGLLQLRSRLRPSEPVVVCFGSKYVTVVNMVLSEGCDLYVLNNDDIGPAVWSKFTNLPNTSAYSDGFFELGPVPNCCWTAAVDVPEGTVSQLCRLLLSRYVRCFERVPLPHLENEFGRAAGSVEDIAQSIRNKTVEGVRVENGLLVLAEGHPVEGCGALSSTAAALLSADCTRKGLILGP